VGRTRLRPVPVDRPVNPRAIATIRCSAVPPGDIARRPDLGPRASALLGIEGCLARSKSGVGCAGSPGPARPVQLAIDRDRCPRRPPGRPAPHAPCRPRARHRGAQRGSRGRCRPPGTGAGWFGRRCGGAGPPPGQAGGQIPLLARLSPYSLGHTAITPALDAGEHLRDVQDLPGTATRAPPSTTTAGATLERDPHRLTRRDRARSPQGYAGEGPGGSGVRRRRLRHLAGGDTGVLRTVSTVRRAWSPAACG
jgi:hypothetical protein